MGYLSKTCSEEEMLEAIRAVLENNVYFSEEVKTTIQEEFVYDLQKPTKNNPNDLSNRELEVLRLTAHGKNTKTIADCLEISPKTVDAHKRKIMDKLDIHSIAGLTKYAIRKQIIHADE